MLIIDRGDGCGCGRSCCCCCCGCCCCALITWDRLPPPLVDGSVTSKRPAVWECLREWPDVGLKALMGAVAGAEPLLLEVLGPSRVKGDTARRVSPAATLSPGPPDTPPLLPREDAAAVAAAVWRAAAAAATAADTGVGREKLLWAEGGVAVAGVNCEEGAIAEPADCCCW